MLKVRQCGFKAEPVRECIFPQDAKQLRQESDAPVARRRVTPSAFSAFQRRSYKASTSSAVPVAVAGRGDDVGGQRRGRGLAIPSAGTALGVEPVAQRLLVEARLRAAG